MEREVVTPQEGTSCFLGEEVVTPPSRILYDLGFIVVCFSAGWSSSYTVKVCFSAGWSSSYTVMVCFSVDFVGVVVTSQSKRIVVCFSVDGFVCVHESDELAGECWNDGRSDQSQPS